MTNKASPEKKPAKVLHYGGRSGWVEVSPPEVEYRDDTVDEKVKAWVMNLFVLVVGFCFLISMLAALSGSLNILFTK